MPKIPWTLDRFDYWVGSTSSGHIRTSKYHIFIPENPEDLIEREGNDFVTENISLCGSVQMGAGDFFDDDEDDSPACFTSLKTFRPDDVLARTDTCVRCKAVFKRDRGDFE